MYESQRGNTIFWFFLSILGFYTLFAFAIGVAAFLGFIKTAAASAVIGIVGGAVGVRQVWPIFIERLRRDLLPPDAIGTLERQLKEYFRRRLATMYGAQEISDSSRLTFVSNQLMQHILIFVSRCRDNILACSGVLRKA